MKAAPDNYKSFPKPTENAFNLSDILRNMGVNNTTHYTPPVHHPSPPSSPQISPAKSKYKSPDQSPLPGIYGASEYDTNIPEEIMDNREIVINWDKYEPEELKYNQLQSGQYLRIIGKDGTVYPIGKIESIDNNGVSLKKKVGFGKAKSFSNPIDYYISKKDVGHGRLFIKENQDNRRNDRADRKDEHLRSEPQNNSQILALERRINELSAYKQEDEKRWAQLRVEMGKFDARVEARAMKQDEKIKNNFDNIKRFLSEKFKK